MGITYEMTATGSGYAIERPGTQLGVDTLHGYGVVIGNVDGTEVVVEDSLPNLVRFFADMVIELCGEAGGEPSAQAAIGRGLAAVRAARVPAIAEAKRAREYVAELFAGEAGILTVRAFPAAARVTYDVDRDGDGNPMVFIKGIYGRDGTELWVSSEGAEWDGETAVREALAGAAEWDPDRDGQGVELDIPQRDDEPEPDADDTASAPADEGQADGTQPQESAPPTIHKMLDLSTRHLPKKYHLGEAPGVFAYELRYGWLMWVPDDPADSSAAMDMAVPRDILAIQLYARKHGCDFVLFDADADTVDDLPTWQ